MCVRKPRSPPSSPESTSTELRAGTTALCGYGRAGCARCPGGRHRHRHRRPPARLPPHLPLGRRPVLGSAHEPPAGARGGAAAVAAGAARLLAAGSPCRRPRWQVIPRRNRLRPRHPPRPALARRPASRASPLPLPSRSTRARRQAPPPARPGAHARPRRPRAARALCGILRHPLRPQGRLLRRARCSHHHSRPHPDPPPRHARARPRSDAVGQAVQPPPPAPAARARPAPSAAGRPARARGGAGRCWAPRGAGRPARLPSSSPLHTRRGLGRRGALWRRAHTLAAASFLPCARAFSRKCFPARGGCFRTLNPFLDYIFPQAILPPFLSAIIRKFSRFLSARVWWRLFSRHAKPKIGIDPKSACNLNQRRLPPQRRARVLARAPRRARARRSLPREGRRGWLRGVE